MKPYDILYENGKYWVARCTYGTGNFRPKTEGFGVYESGVTHSIRVAQIGFDGEYGLNKAKETCDVFAQRDFQ